MKKIFLILVLFCAVMTVSSQVVEPNDLDTAICAGASLTWDLNGQTYTESGEYEYSFDDNGTVRTVTLRLTVLPEVPIHTDSITICYGETYEWQGKSYTESAVDTIRLQDLNGCDSVVSLHLTVLPEVPIHTDSISICYGKTYEWQGKSYTESSVDTIILQDQNGCDSVITLLLTVFPEVPDTEIYDTICSGEIYELHGISYGVEGDYTMTLENMSHCDSIVNLHLTVLPVTEYTLDTTIIEGESYSWMGVYSVYSEPGIYEQVDTIENVFGCDSIITLKLHVLENNVVLHSLETVEMCADDSVIQLMIDWEGYVDSVGLYFVRDTLDSIETGLRDAIVAMPADGGVSIPINSCVRAGVHEMQVIGYFRREVMFEESAILTVLYPSSVLEQRWDDVICVLTSGYNGGYDFTAFQWYKDGSMLTGETGYYLNQKLEKGAEYSVLLTDQSGTQLMTCPIRIGYEEPDIRVEPTLVYKRQPVRCQVAEVANMWVYDTMGKLQISNVLHQGRNDVQLPQQSGMYMLKVVLQTGEERTFKVLVL